MSRAVLMPLLAAICAAGARADLIPPGPPDSTPPRVEPRIPLSDANTPSTTSAIYDITAPGSYYLTENLFGPTGRAGIWIHASDVTIDLMGFEIAAEPGTLSQWGIFVSGLDDLENITIRNGTIRDWQIDGITLSGSTGVLIEDIRALDNGGSGIQAGHGATVRRCVARDNGGAGIALGDFGIAENCIAGGNSLRGIQTGESSIVTGSVATRCSGGIRLGPDSMALACVASENTGVGIQGGIGAFIADCSVTGNGGHGILVGGNRSLVRGNLCRNNGTVPTDTGILIDENVVGCRVEGNSLVQNQRGILAPGSRSVIVSNSFHGNGVNIPLLDFLNIWGRGLNFNANALFVLTEDNSTIWNNVVH